MDQSKFYSDLWIMSYDIFQTKFRSYHRIYATTYNHCTLYVYVYDPGWALSPLLTPMRTIAALKLVVWKCAIGGSTYFPRDEDLISPPGWLISFLCQSRTVEQQLRYQKTWFAARLTHGSSVSFAGLARLSNSRASYQTSGAHEREPEGVRLVVISCLFAFGREKSFLQYNALADWLPTCC